MTRRTLYVPPSAKQVHPGVNMINDYLLTGVKGYNSRIVKERRLTLRNLFDSENEVAQADPGAKSSGGDCYGKSATRFPAGMAGKERNRKIALERESHDALAG